MNEFKPTVEKQYVAAGAIEQIKIIIIGKINLLYDTLSVLFSGKMLNRRDDKNVALFKSTLISLYLFLRPKVVEYCQRKGKNSEQYSALLTLDNFIFNPNDLDIVKAISYLNLLNSFCHDYGVTRIEYFAGTKGESIYSI